MSNEANDKGWLLHSLAQARRFGPMTEEELRGYFRAGMVKSVDRLTAPGDFVMRPAAEVAMMLGETVPAGPPPPELEQAPTPTPPPPPPIAAAVVKESSEERAAKAAAAMNIDLAALMASNAPPRRRSGWLVPVVIFAVLVLALLMGLNMLRKLQTSASASAELGPTTLPGSIDDGVTITDPRRPTPGDARPVPVPVPGGAGTGATDEVFDGRLARAQALQDTRNWTALAPFAREWAQAQPDRSEPLHFLGLAYSGLGEYRLALEPLKTVYAREPENAQARSLLADAYLQSERWTEAAAMYKQMVVVAPDDARLWNNYGAALNGSGQQVQAVAALENAVRLDPTFKQAWSNLGNLYQAMGDSTRASAALANGR